MYATLERDAQTAEFIARIEELKAATDPGPALEVPADCTGTSPLAAPAAASRCQPAMDRILDGHYRFEFTDDELRELGVDNPGYASTRGLHAGRWRTEREFDQIGEGVSDHHEGTYEVAGDAVSFTEEGLDPRVHASIQLHPTVDAFDRTCLHWTTWERIDGDDVSNEPQQVSLDGTSAGRSPRRTSLPTNANDMSTLATSRRMFTVALEDGGDVARTAT